MSITTTVTLDEDVFEDIQEFARQHGVSVDSAFNEVTRAGLTMKQVRHPKERYRITPLPMKPKPGIDFECTSKLLAEDDERLLQEKQKAGSLP